MSDKNKRIILVKVDGRKPRRFASFETFERYAKSVDSKANIKVSYTAK